MFKWIKKAAMFARYFPLILIIVPSIETVLGDESGEKKKEIALDSVIKGLAFFKLDVKPDHLETISGLIDLTVDIFNGGGIFGSNEKPKTKQVAAVVAAVEEVKLKASHLTSDDPAVKAFVSKQIGDNADS